MIKKIVSGGQTGADQAALDAAIKLDITHGGWIPKGRLTEDGPLPKKYRLLEMASSSYPKRTEQNVIDSDATLIFSHGELGGGSRLTRELSAKHEKPCLHINLNTITAFDAARKISSWTTDNNIEILNVAGSRASGDPEIYNAVTDILEAFFFLDLMQTKPTKKSNYSEIPVKNSSYSIFPQTLEQAVERLAENMALKDKVTVANMTEQEMESLYIRLEKYIINNFGLLHGNDNLMRSCSFEMNIKNPDDRDAAEIIIKELWKMLRKTHRLKIVK